MSKKHADHSISDILRINPKWFVTKQTDPDKSAQLLQILEHILASGFTNLASESFLAVFKQFDISAYEVSDLTRLMATYTPPAPRSAPKFPALAALSRDEKIAILSSRKEAVNSQIDDVAEELDAIDRRITETVQYLDKYNKQLSDYSEKYARKSALLQDLERLRDSAGYDYSFLKRFMGLPPHYRVLGVDGTNVLLLRTKRVIMAHMDPVSKVSKTLDMGFFAFSVSLSTTKILGIFPVFDVPRISNGTLHPHFTSASVCYGNYSARAEELHKSGDIASHFGLIDNLLDTYCPDSPFRRWEEFEKARKKGEVREPFGSPLTKYRDLILDSLMHDDGVRAYREECESKRAEEKRKRRESGGMQGSVLVSLLRAFMRPVTDEMRGVYNRSREAWLVTQSIAVSDMSGTFIPASVNRAALQAAMGTVPSYERLASAIINTPTDDFGRSHELKLCLQLAVALYPRGFRMQNGMICMPKSTQIGTKWRIRVGDMTSVAFSDESGARSALRMQIVVFYFKSRHDSWGSTYAEQVDDNTYRAAYGHDFDATNTKYEEEL